MMNGIALDEEPKSLLDSSEFVIDIVLAVFFVSLTWDDLENGIMAAMELTGWYLR